MPDAQTETAASDVVSVNQDNLDAFNAEAMGLPVKTESEDDQPETGGPEESTDDESEAAEPEAKADDDDTPAKKKPKKNSFQERIKDLSDERTAAREEAARERAESERLRKELEALRNQETKDTDKPKEADGKPNQDDFKDWADYVEALSDWKVEQKFKQREIERAEQAVVQSWQKRVEAAKAELPNYEQVIADSDLQIHNAVIAAIQESELGPQLAYHLATNPELAEKLQALSVASQVREIGRIEALLAKPIEKPASKPDMKISKAPAPVTPIKGTTTFENKVDADGNFHGTPEEFKALRQAGKIK